MASTQTQGSPVGGRRAPTPGRRLSPRGGSDRRHPRVRRLIFAVLAVFLAFAVWVGWTIYPVLTRPGTDSVAARIAEWGRDHHLGAPVTWLEGLTYSAPKVGGRIDAHSPLAHPALVPAARALPPALAPFASPALPGEGTWHTLAMVHGKAAVAAAYLRPDAIHTSYTAGVVWFDPALVRAQLNPGTLDPGGSGWGAPSSLGGVNRSALVGAFNSGFRLSQSQGGYYENGKTARPLVAGAASMIFTKSGGLTVGAWGTDAQMGPNIAAVRQNLSLLVDGGQIVPGVSNNAGSRWGKTIGNAKYVWRSGLGVRADGTVVYVASDRLTALSLAAVLQRAGVIRGMELDINPEWTSFVRYNPGPSNLLPGMQNSPRRYDEPSSRDFVSLFARL